MPSPQDRPQSVFPVCEFPEADVCQTGLGDHPNVCLSWASELLLPSLIFETSRDGCSR